MQARIRLASIAGALLGLSCLLAAQQPGPLSQSPVFREAVDVVQLDVRVTGRDRRPVIDLESADFTVLENGQARPVVSVSRVTSPPREPSTATWRVVSPDVVTNTVPDGGFVVILLDRTIPYGWAASQARRMATAIVERLGQHDVGAVISTVAGGHPQNFTADVARLAEAVQTMPLGTSLSKVVEPMAATLAQAESRSAECYCDLCSLEAITHVAKTLSSVTGRPKTLFFIGSNIEPLALEKPEYLRDACAPIRLAAVAEMRAATQLANLVVHTLDPTGLETPSQFSADRRGNGREVIGTQRVPRNQNTLLVLAEVTGGRAVLNSNDPSARIDELMDEMASFYLLGFTPASVPDATQLRRVDVKVNRPGVAVQTRRSFYPSPGSRRGAVTDPGVVSVPSSLSGLLPATAVRLGMNLVPWSPSSAAPKLTVAVIIGVEQEWPGASAVDAARPLVLRVAAFDTEGRERAARDARIDAHTLRGAAPYDVVARLDLPPGRYEVRAAVDAPGAAGVGSVYGYVEVPDLRRERLRLMGPLLSLRSGRPVHITEGGLADLPVHPTAQRTLAADDHATASFRIHQGDGPPVPTAMRMQILSTDDRLVFQEERRLDAAQFASASTTNVDFDLPLARLSAGSYLLRVTAQAGRATSERSITFQVR